jgi:hypothetical protein
MLRSLATLAAAYEHGASAAVEIAFLKRERFTDPQSRAPQQDDQRAETVALGAIADRSHHRDDLLDRAATVTDRDGQEVVLLARIWEEKITRDHPELVDHLDAVMETVAKPDHVEPDGLPARSRFYRRNAEPSHWLMAVVSYEQRPARIITALANRKDPKRWKP